MIHANKHLFTPHLVHRTLCELTLPKLRFLEQTLDLMPGAKVELLSLLSHKKWIGELDIRRERVEHSEQHIHALQQLGIPWRTGSNAKSDGTTIYWIQIGANEAVLDYIDEYKDEIGALETGVLYGYPLTAVLGFLRVIEPEGGGTQTATHHKNVAEFYLSGVFSAAFVQQETEYFNHIWQSLKQLSPKIIAEAESFYNRWQKERGAWDKTQTFSTETWREQWQCEYHQNAAKQGATVACDGKA